MTCTPLAIPDVKLLTPKKFGDHRGFFCETYSKKLLGEFGIVGEFVQDNHSMSAPAGTVRALHYQLPPAEQGKLVRVVAGSILDVAVDIRRGSPTFGKHVAAVLSAENFQMMWVPAGFAHGFETLEPATQVIYKVTNPYSPPHERGILWNDPAVGVAWRTAESAATLSDRDRRHPLLKDQPDVF